MLFSTLTHRLLVFIACLASQAVAQTCPPQWQPGTPSKLLSGNVQALRAFDPDGAGPLGTWLIAGGNGLEQLGTPSAPLRAFDGTAWRSITGNLTSQSGGVTALTVYNGELIAAGRFDSIGGVPAANIARWDGTTWRPLAQGVSDTINALEVHAGSLFVGGQFQTVGAGISSPGVARWNGTSWSAVSSSLSVNTTVYTLRSFRNNLYAGGNFTSLGGASATNLAVWNNSTWAAFGQPDRAVRDIQAFTAVAATQDRLFVAGDFTTINAQTIDRVAIWNPSTTAWTQAGTPPTGSVTRLAVRPSGISSYQLSAVFGGRLHSLISGTWTFIGDSFSPGNAFVSAIAVYNGQWAIGRTGQGSDASVKLLSSNLWTNPGPGTPGYTTVVADAGGGAIIAGSHFPSVSSSPFTLRAFNTVSRREPNSDTWTQLGGIFLNTNSTFSTTTISALATMPNGDIIAGGTFNSIDSQQIASPARWNGSAWTAIGTAISAPIYDLLPMPNGDLYAAGSFLQIGGAPGSGGIARWNGTTWSSVGGGLNASNYGFRLAKHSSGDIILAGRFTTIGAGGITNNIARWNGTNWSPIGSGIPLASDENIYAVAVAPNGNIAVCASFFDGLGLGRSTIYLWDQTFWRIIAQQTSQLTLLPPINTLKFLPDGSLVAAGIFDSFQGVSTNSIARWNGTWNEFSPIGIVLRDGPAFVSPGLVEDLELLSTGEFVIAGNFSHADNLVSAYIARATIPTLCACDDIDFNNNTVFPEDQDVIDFFNVLAGAECPACNDIDFNNNTVFPEDQDVIDFFRVLAGGDCP